ncbi:WD40 repeat domain-containing protein [Streptosporangium sp. NBC_01756]|uniref:WD40 repeat domain-containing protein n=1 Tax=Streptosporangium sp. NBC_01756 TaxID=2975950 RepID=UPI002DD8BA93|nr:WD40 repeat domain-containing protein [Streptosporangium sp. NBC_01756]WSC86497.1 WD40 repeat domain-containing protein [Streptosporangium sp. NBC_01756]
MVMYLRSVVVIVLCLGLLTGSARVHAPCAAEPVTMSAPQVLDTGGHSDVTSVAFGRLNGRPIAISAGEEGFVRFWRLPGLTPAAEPLEGTAAAFLDLDGRPAVLTSGRYGSRLWDLATRTVLLNLSKHASALSLGSRGVLVNDEGTVRIWNPRSRTYSPRIGAKWMGPMAVGRIGRQVLLASYLGQDSDSLGIWDVATREMIGNIMYGGGQYDVPRHLEIIDVAGRPTLVTEAERGIDQWDLATRRKVHPLIDDGENDAMDAFASSTGATVDGQALMITGEDRSDDNNSAAPVDNAVVLWDPVRGRRLAAMRGHSDAVRALAAGELDSRPVLLSGSDDNTVRLWDLRTRRQLGDPTPSWPSQGVGALAIGRRDGALIAVSAETSGLLRVWDLTTRRPLGRPMKAGHDIGTLAFTEVDGLPVVVAGGWSGITMWNLITFTELGRLAVNSLYELAVWQNRVVAVVAPDTRILAHIWDLRTRRLLDTIDLGPKAGDPAVSLVDGRVFATVPTRAGSTVPRDSGSIAVWDLSRRRQISTITVPPPAWEDEHITFGRVAWLGCRPAVSVARQGAKTRLLDVHTGRDLVAPITGLPVNDTPAAVAGTILALLVWRTPGQDTYYSQFWDLSAMKPLGSPTTTLYHSIAVGEGVVIAGGPGEQLTMWRTS